MKLDSKALPNGGIRIELDGKSEEMPAHIATAFISRMIGQMQMASPDVSPQGGAVLHPDNLSVNRDTETGALNLVLRMGPVLFQVALPPGLLEQVAKDVLKS